MKYLLILNLLVVLVACETEKNKQDTRQLRQELKAAWEKSETYTMVIVDQMPEELFRYKTTDSTMTYTEQWRHCAIYTCGQLAGRFDLVNPYIGKKPTVNMSKDSVLAELRKMYAFVQKTIDQLPDEKLLGSVEFAKDTIPGWRLIYAMENHIIHHRGQCIVYLRLNGIKPKGYYGW